MSSSTIYTEAGTPSEPSHIAPCSHGRQDFEPHFRTRDPITGETYWVGCCRACGLHVSWPQPDHDEIQKFYPPSYYGSGRRYLLFIEWLLRRMYDARIKRITGGHQPGRVLDVGCGRGLLLARLRDLGWDAHGTELSHSSAAHASQVLNLTVYTQPLEELGFPTGSFDLVIIWHVLEHMHHPRGTLKEIARILKPGGTLLVAVPNFASWEARFGQRHWFHLNAPGHLYHFTPQTLRRLLGEAGFHVRHRTFFSAEYDFFSFVQTVENRLGLRFNLLYDLLRTPSARFGDPERKPDSRLQQAVALLLAIPLGLLSLIYAPLVALCRQGATLQVLASRDGGQERTAPLATS